MRSAWLRETRGAPRAEAGAAFDASANTSLAGRVFDLTNSYDTMWWISAGLGLVAALLNWPIRERPVARVLAEAAAAR